jgi:hypothetical protein
VPALRVPFLDPHPIQTLRSFLRRPLFRGPVHSTLVFGRNADRLEREVKGFPSAKNNAKAAQLESDRLRAEVERLRTGRHTSDTERRSEAPASNAAPAVHAPEEKP